MITPITLATPRATKCHQKYDEARTINRIVFTIWKRTVYTSHGKISFGFSCKEKKPIEIGKLFYYGVAKIFFHNIQ
jgi:hypothetical protein